MRFEFDRAVDTTRKKGLFKEGNRDNFMFGLGMTCCRKHIDLNVALALASQRFGDSDFELTTPLTNGYCYGEKAEEEHPQKMKLIDRVTDFLSARYDFRRNVVTDCLEFADRMKADNGALFYQPIDDYHYNSIYVEAQLADIKATKVYLQTIINSNFTRDYHPFRHYFESLPERDGYDYIGELADSVKNTGDDVWHDTLKRWLVWMEAGASQSQAVNQHAVMLYSTCHVVGQSTYCSCLYPIYLTIL